MKFRIARTFWTLGVWLLACPAFAQALPTPNLGCNTKINGTTIGCPAGVAVGGTGAATITGLVKGNGSSPFSAATAGTDYLAPAGSGAGLTNLNASNLASGTVAAARGGAGTVSGALRGNGAGTVSQAACADLSNAATGCSTATGTSGATIPLNNSANTFSALQTFNNGIAANQAPTSAHTLDSSGSGNQITINNGANAVLAPAYTGLVVVTDVTNGAAAAFLATLGAQTLIAQQGNWQTGTSPAAGNSSFGWNGSAFAIYNNSGAAHTYNLAFIKTH